MIELNKNIFWIGIKDWELKEFHGHELSTSHGSTYNSYVIKDEKTVLIDTVWHPHKKQYLDTLDREVGIKNIDIIIVNHMEPDHSGCLEDILNINPEIRVVCSKNGVKSIKGYIERELNVEVVKTGDKINIGEYNLTFIDMTMLHWPDSMMTYIEEVGLVFSNDAFGQHFCAASIFNDEGDACVIYQEAIKYYANILSPYSAVLKRKIKEIEGMNLNIKMIAPSHGVIWRENPMQIVSKYAQWCDDYTEDYVLIIYDSMYGATERMAREIGRGIESKSKKFKMFNASISDLSDLVTEIFKAGAIALGSSTVNNSTLTSVGNILHEIEVHKIKNKPFIAFGSYGWSGEAHNKINEKLEKIGLEAVDAPVKALFMPDKDELEQCYIAGEKIAMQLT